MPTDPGETHDPTIDPQRPGTRDPARDTARDTSRAAQSPNTSTPQPHDAQTRAQRFNPGDTLADRYRIVAFLGRGGMGEVYRADDLELAQSVAIKLLPARIASDANLTERVRTEVRLARGISHKNVCRIHDIARLPADQGGDLFISMEYIDGEDLATLLPRIGKLPQDKAVDVARQLCAAIAAAHDQGVIHRDIKPANIMLDGRGNARLTDFGIAAIDDHTDPAQANAGTPAYMAPEQFAGEAVTKQSDIYALGLVIFELLTGKPAWNASTYAELKTLRQTRSTPAALTSISNAGVDPALAALVERCTETNPDDRPPSAMAVAAALPGADPIAAAIAAGETPSPELVAAMGGKGALKPVAAAILSLTTIAFVTLALILTRGTTLLTVAPPPAAPPLMEAAAYEILENLGHAQPEGGPVQTGWTTSERALEHVANAIADGHVDSWNALAEPFADPIRFWFRIEPNGFQPDDPGFIVSINDPPRLDPGSIFVALDGDRLLKELRIAPAQRVDQTANSGEPDWSIAFDAAGLDINQFQPTEAIYRDRADADLRRGWKGTTPAGQSNLPPLEIEVFAGAADGKITEFSIRRTDAEAAPPPWPADDQNTEQPSETASASPDQTTDASATAPPAPRGIDPNSAAAQIIAGIAQAIFLVVVTLVAAVLAYRNYRLGRCDMRRATRLGLTVFALTAIATLINVNTPPFTLKALLGPYPIYAFGLGFSLILVACYIAVEPLARSRWPGSLVSWTRLFGGNFTDPMIGRDVLIGLVGGSTLALFGAIAQFAAEHLQSHIGPNVGRPTSSSVEPALAGLPTMLAQCIAQIAFGLINAAAIALLVLIVMVVLGFIRIRHRWPAILVVSLLVFAQSLAVPNLSELDRAAFMLGALSIIIVLDRFGLLAAAGAIIAGAFASYIIDAAPFDQWWAPATFVPTTLLAAALIFAYRTSTYGKSLFAPSPTH